MIGSLIFMMVIYLVANVPAFVFWLAKDNTVTYFGVAATFAGLCTAYVAIWLLAFIGTGQSTGSDSLWAATATAVLTGSIAASLRPSKKKSESL